MKKRKVYVRTISKTRSMLKTRKPSGAKCAGCGVKLKGVPRMTKSKMRNMAKTVKRPSRPYGGVLCPKCLKIKIRKESRKNV